MRRFMLFIIFTLPPAILLAQETPPPEEILQRAALFGQFSSLRVDLDMEINERRGAKNRGLEAFVVREDDASRALIQITSPAFLNNLKFLSTSEGGDTTQWLATSRGVRRVASSGRNDRLFDSDFTVEDLSDYDPNDFNLAVLGSETINGSEAWVLEAIPVDAQTDYAKRVMHVDTSSGLLVLAEFLDDDGEVVRRFELLEEMELGGIPFPKRVRMTTVDAGTFTDLTVETATVGEDIPDRLFNRGNL